MDEGEKTVGAAEKPQTYRNKGNQACSMMATLHPILHISCSCTLTVWMMGEVDGSSHPQCPDM